MPGTAEYLKRWRKKHPGYHRRWMRKHRETYKVPLEKGCTILGVKIRKDLKQVLARVTHRGGL